VANKDNVTRLAVIGIGQELRGDDAAGLEVVRRLRELMPKREDLLLIEAGPAPENFTGPLRRFHPTQVILVDAALMGASPGGWFFLDWRDTAKVSGSTHMLPVDVLAAYLERELGCTVDLVGIQPYSNGLGEEMSLVVQRSVEQVAQTLSRLS